MRVPTLPRFRAAVLPFLAALLLPALRADSLRGQQAGLPVGATAPEVRVQTLDGASVAFGEFVGDTPVIVEFWATWCPLCRALEPGFAELHDEYGDALRIVRIGVPENQSREQQRTYVERRGIGGVHLFDPEGEAYRAFAATHTSYVVVLDTRGRVTYTGVGKDQDLRAAVATALEPQPPH